MKKAAMAIALSAIALCSCGKSTEKEGYFEKYAWPVMKAEALSWEGYAESASYSDLRAIPRGAYLSKWSFVFEGEINGAAFSERAWAAYGESASNRAHLRIVVGEIGGRRITAAWL